jgi:hypothetical protein
LSIRNRKYCSSKVIRNCTRIAVWFVHSSTICTSDYILLQFVHSSTIHTFDTASSYILVQFVLWSTFYYNSYIPVQFNFVRFVKSLLSKVVQVVRTEHTKLCYCRFEYHIESKFLREKWRILVIIFYYRYYI